MPKLHVHIYDQESEADDNLIKEIDLEVLETSYGYDQYGFELDGKWIEIRVPQQTKSVTQPTH